MSDKPKVDNPVFNYAFVIIFFIQWKWECSHTEAQCLPYGDT